MESIHFQHNALTAAEITTRRLCRLHRVRLFSPALRRVKRGSKVIVQGEPGAGDSATAGLFCQLMWNWR